MKCIKSYCLIAAIASGTAGCHVAGLEETVLPARVDYQCANNRVLQVKRMPEQGATAVLINEQAVILQRMGSAAQEKYSDGQYTLYLHGERAMLEQNGQVLFASCSAGPLPKTKRDGFSGE